MTEPPTLAELTALAAQLPPNERKQLADTLLRDLASPPRPRRLWREIRGSVPHPLFGEDAQAWVSRTRREADDHRDLHRRPTG
jgi:hypothetical protein